MKNRRYNSVGVHMFRTVMAVYMVVAMVTTLLLIIASIGAVALAQFGPRRRGE